MRTGKKAFGEGCSERNNGGDDKGLKVMHGTELTNSQFINKKGYYCFAYPKGKKVNIAVTHKKGKIIKTLKLAKKYSLFGGATCDKVIIGV